MIEALLREIIDYIFTTKFLKVFLLNIFLILTYYMITYYVLNYNFQTLYNTSLGEFFKTKDVHQVTFHKYYTYLMVFMIATFIGSVGNHFLSQPIQVVSLGHSVEDIDKEIFKESFLVRTRKGEQVYRSRIDDLPYAKPEMYGKILKRVIEKSTKINDEWTLVDPRPGKVLALLILPLMTIGLLCFYYFISNSLITELGINLRPVELSGSFFKTQIGKYLVFVMIASSTFFFLKYTLRPKAPILSFKRSPILFSIENVSEIYFIKNLQRARIDNKHEHRKKYYYYALLKFKMVNSDEFYISPRIGQKDFNAPRFAPGQEITEVYKEEILYPGIQYE